MRADWGRGLWSGLGSLLETAGGEPLRREITGHNDEGKMPEIGAVCLLLSL